MQKTHGYREFDEEDLIPQKYERLTVNTEYGNGTGYVSYCIEGSEIHVNSDDDEPAMLCIPQGERIGYLVLDKLMKKAKEVNASSIFFHGPTSMLEKFLDKYAKSAGIEPKKITDKIESSQNILAISEMILNLPAKSL